jgi:hypothetical protein
MLNMRRLLILLSFIAPLFAAAQEITGVWHGHFRSSNNISARSSIYDDRYKFEVQIAQNSKSIQAVTYSYLSSIFYGKASADGTVNVQTGKVLLQEQKLLEFRQDQPGGVCIMTCFLQYSRSGDEEFLEGTYVSMNMKDSSNCGRGTVFLRKVPASDFYEEPFLVKKEKEINKEETAKTDSPARTGTTAEKAHETVKSKPRPASTTTKPATTAARPAPATTKPGNATANNRPRTRDSLKTRTPATGTGAIAKTGPAPRPATHPPPPIALADVSNHPIHPTIGDSSTAIGKKFATVPPQVLRSRSNQVVRNLVVNTNEVVLNIYDDGAIDHDTISVYLDNKQVINHAMLTDRPIVLILHLDESNDYHELVMVAENEGEIPPNTSLMIVKAGDKEYEVRITSTEQKNAVVTFKFEKPK